MAQASAPSQRRRPPRFLFRFINPLFKLILCSLLHRLFSKRLMLLSFTGRRTGKRYTIVVGYADVGEALLLGTESAWKNNLRGGAPVRVRLRGRERPGTADVISDEAGMTESYGRMIAASPGYGRAIGVSLLPGGRPDPEDVARARREGHVVVRIQLGP